jgi:hypothetical protein
MDVLLPFFALKSRSDRAAKGQYWADFAPGRKLAGLMTNLVRDQAAPTVLKV